MNNADIPAMPVPGLSHDDDFNGLSKREYFAAMAMQGILAHPSVKSGDSHRLVAVQSINFARALLAELERTGGGS